MKKLLCVACCVVLSLGLAACMGKAPIGKRLPQW
jgi:hypothetical protein